MSDLFEQRVEATLRQLRQWCADQDIEPAGDGAVPESVASRILGYSERALAKQYEFGVLEIPFRRLGNRRMYRLPDLARHIESTFFDESM